MSVTVIVGGDVVPAFGNLSGFCQGDKAAIIDDACLTNNYILDQGQAGLGTAEEENR